MNANPLLVLFGQRLRHLRQEANLTQEELGIRAGIDQKEISQMELGRTNVSLTTQERLARALKVSLSELMDFPFPPKE